MATYKIDSKFLARHPCAEDGSSLPSSPSVEERFKRRKAFAKTYVCKLTVDMTADDQAEGIQVAKQRKKETDAYAPEKGDDGENQCFVWAMTKILKK